MKKIFIVGCPRSGTTMTGRLLGSCRNTTYWEESGVIDKLASKSYQTQEEIDSFLKYISMSFGMEPKDMPNPKYNLFHLALEAGLTISEELLKYNKFQGQDLVDVILKHAFKNGKRNWIEKTPSHTFQYDLIKKLYPDSKILHIYRHPLDVMASFKEWSLKNYDEWTPESACQIWNDYFGYASMKSDFSIKYKDIAFHKIIVKQLVEKLKLDWTKDCDELYDKVTDKNVESWESRLTRREIWIGYKMINWEMAERAGFFPY